MARIVYILSESSLTGPRLGYRYAVFLQSEYIALPGVCCNEGRKASERLCRNGKC
jgi:hypothetical protein